MLKRIISALIGAPLLLGLAYMGGMYTAFLVTLLSLLALREFLGLGKLMGNPVWYAFGITGAVIWLAILFWGYTDWLPAVVIVWLLLCLGRAGIAYPGVTAANAGFNFLAWIYTVVLISHLYLLRQLDAGVKWVFFTFFLVWANDTGAYLVGRAWGRHPLAPRVSPNKTVEGAIGGLLLSMLTGLVSWRWIGRFEWEFFLILSLLAAAVAQVGDLFESALKREAGVKDSGNLIPGHGGILDRFDSLVFALPVVYYLVLWRLMG